MNKNKSKKKRHLRKAKEVGEVKPFTLKNPKWVLYFLCISAPVCLIAFILLLGLKNSGRFGDGIYFISYTFLALSIASAIGIYACIYEKLTFDGVSYLYYRPFGKNRSASKEDIEFVKLLTILSSDRYGALRKKQRVLFYGKNEELLIKILDDGTISDNESFLKSLRASGIRIKREEINKYY